MLKLNLKLSDDAAETEHRSMQRFETHLVFDEKLPRDSERRERVVVFESWTTVDDSCPCHKTLPATPPMSKWLPEEVRQSVMNALFLASSTVRDELTCCDVAQAIRGAVSALDQLADRLETWHRERDEHDAEYVEIAASGSSDEKRRKLRLIEENQASINNQVHLFELWHLFVERVLRQRTVASFEEILLRSDRNVVYRGSVQKFLFLADALMKEFAARITGGGDPPQLWTMYDSTTRILSIPSMGLVRIPARHLFRLTSVIPDLWHEVGVCRFYEKVDVNKLQKLDLASGKRDYVTDDEYHTLADRYGDLVVYNFGFACRWNRFIISHVRAWLDAYDVGKVSSVLYEEEFDALLRRLVFVMVVSADWGDSPNAVTPVDDQTKPLVRCLGAVQAAYQKVVDVFSDPASPKLIPLLTQKMLEKTAERVTEEWLMYGDSLKEHFKKTVDIDAIAVAEATGKRYEAMVKENEGELVQLAKHDDLNLLLGELYWELRSNLLRHMPPAAPFQRSAAFVRSAIIEYHRRQAKFNG